MATLLRAKDSTDRHLNLCYRHVRLCQKQKGTETLVGSIQVTSQNLTRQREITQQKQLAREEAFDDVMLADSNLDNGVKTVHEKCNQFDRNNPGENVLPLIFPDGKFTSITNLNRYAEPAEVNRLIVRIEKLGSNHPLFGEAQALRTLVSASQTAIDKFHAAEIAEKIAITEEEMARAAARKQFELNYLEARKLFGKLLAERLFPRIIPGGKKEPKPAATPSAT